MRISKEKAAANRDEVVVAAARLFRARGLDGVGVDAVAEAAGLTHGAVYSHFKSKNALAAQAVRQALHQSMREWLSLTEGPSATDAFEKLLKTYVSRSHRDHPEAGCSVAAIGADANRGDDDLREVFRDGVTQFIEVLAAVSPDATEVDRRRTAILRAAAMVGALVMSRAAAADKALSDEILAVVRRRLIDVGVGGPLAG
ncbi:TetR/AcrR family transcriptional regulator [Bradyrhizobium sp. LHD-71]|uniref:TetR/AcrR family transcriptional regulator n=1 Tax=Bradyrhizobium sp. LHD-71 TaxID=3072141 RepID=UPI00280E7DE0|nr:TetR/AcrR family transcriptional regulator [Bradyrhizobium sp. LHD-71]MDQ8726955.1 TetR/AcrR family transcriptional regulator [Bradyrhizobium sp. LHD-71]